MIDYFLMEDKGFILLIIQMGYNDRIIPMTNTVMPWCKKMDGSIEAGNMGSNPNFL